MTTFEHYLADHKIDPLYLSIEAHVRYLIVYNAKKGHPITPENAQKIKQAVYNLTGAPYTGPLVLIPEQPTKQDMDRSMHNG
jgi:hypothetical protein